jgi:hypothetical protein
MSKSRIIFAGVALFVTLICWSLSSPINSHADERYYIGSIWCANGYDKNCLPLGRTKDNIEVASVKLGLCTPIGIEETYKRVLVDQNEVQCRYKTRNNDSLADFKSTINNQIESIGYVGTDFNRTNHPVFYQKFMNIFVTENGALSVVLIRIFNSFIFSVLFTVLLLLGPKEVKKVMIIAFLSIAVPFTLFQIASINPSSWAITGCSFSWAYLYCLIRQRKDHRLKLFFLALGWIISIAMVFSARHDAKVFIIFTNFCVLLLFLSQVAAKESKKIKLIGLSMFATAILIITRQNSQVLKNISSINTDTFFDVKNQFLAIGGTIKVLIATPLRILGYESLGWLATFVPTVVVASGLLISGGLLLNLLSKNSRQQIVALTIFVSFSFLIVYSQMFGQLSTFPPFYLIRTAWRGDTFFSARYFVPLVIFYVAALVILSSNIKRFFEKDISHVFLNLLPFTHTVSLITVGKIFRENPSWYWANFSLGVNSVAIIGSISFFAFTFLVSTHVLAVKPTECQL